MAEEAQRENRLAAERVKHRSAPVSGTGGVVDGAALSAWRDRAW
jgi:hypothetical protein